LSAFISAWACWYGLVERPTSCCCLLIVVVEVAWVAILFGLMLLSAGWNQLNAGLTILSADLISSLFYIVSGGTSMYAGFCALMLGLQDGGCMKGGGGGGSAAPDASAVGNPA
jgi:hypothetical protein